MGVGPGPISPAHPASAVNRTSATTPRRASTRRERAISAPVRRNPPQVAKSRSRSDFPPLPANARATGAFSHSPFCAAAKKTLSAVPRFRATQRKLRNSNREGRASSSHFRRARGASVAGFSIPVWRYRNFCSDSRRRGSNFRRERTVACDHGRPAPRRGGRAPAPDPADQARGPESSLARPDVCSPGGD